MVLAEGRGEPKMDATERQRAEAVVWQGSVGELALHTDSLLVFRGPKAVHMALARGQFDLIKAFGCA